tara:strand:+ start:334 stop:657 length:324 start_codon:yes stop_codon:yes gene_type:complete
MTTSSLPSKPLRAMARRRLPKLLRKAASDYAAFAAQSPPTDAKGFAAHQAACKAALAHLDAGLKLLAWAEGADKTRDSANDDLTRMLDAARAAVAEADDASPDGEAI